MSFLSTFLGNHSSGGGAGPHGGIISNDLKRLDKIRPGLGDQAVAYVRTGADATVLATITTLCQANELEVCRSYVDHRSKATPDRRTLFAKGDPYDLALMHRYTEVLAAAAANIPQKGASRFSPETISGTEKAPRLLRIFFSEAFLGLREHQTWPPKPTPLHNKGLVLDNAIAMSRLLGGDVIDLFDALYVSDNPYHDGGRLYRNAVSILPAVQAHGEAFRAAMRRMPAAGRIAAMENLASWEIGKSADFVPFLIEQAGEGAKGVREAANAALRGASSETLAPLAIMILQTGDAEQRGGMVDVLARLGTPEAMEALRAHREGEKTARIVTAIDNALSLGARPQATSDDESGYTAIDGQRIECPPLVALQDGPRFVFGEAERAALAAHIATTNARTRSHNEENQRRGIKHQHPYIPDWYADQAITALNSVAPPKADNKGNVLGYLTWGDGRTWLRTAMARMPEAQSVALARRLHATSPHLAALYGPGSEQVLAYLNGPRGDLRAIEALDIEAKATMIFGGWRDRHERPIQRGDFLRHMLDADHYSYGETTLEQLPRNAVWPYLASNLAVFDEVFGLAPPPAKIKLDRVRAVRLLKLLPATPSRYFAPILEIATGESKHGRTEARAMLNSAPEVEARLVALLDDSRQAMRAGAADWLALRRDASALAALNKRLKKEKSEVARAAILSGLKRLGQDLSDVLGPQALVAEAEKGLKSAKFDKLQWMALDNIGHMRFRDGSKAPPEMLRWWLYSAFKLKQPGGNALYEIYLDQLDPRDAEAFSTWVLDSWVGYDTAKPDEAAANAHAKASAKTRAQAYQRWQPNYTEDMAFASLKAEYMAQYPNSGADSKGVLALATRAPSALAADRVRAYLKAHGQRTSQSSALLEMLAAKSDPVALQVVIAAATRLKQKGVQKFAGELITRVAESRDWTLDELADRTVPTAGFDEDGVLALACGEDAKIYEARVLPDLTVVLRNPAGKEVANLPSGQDEASKTAKKQLATTKKELKQIVSMQSARLYEALCAERSWSIEDWKRSFHDHPVMRRLVERAVWLGLDADGAVRGAFRPTAEGDFTDTNDAPVDIDQFARVRIAHGALMDETQGKAWSQHLEDYEIKPLFTQFGRTLMRIGKDDTKKTEIQDRKGWLTDAFTIRGAAAKLGYERGPALDGGFFNEYRKPFASAGLAAVIEFTGNGLPEQNVPAAITVLRFERATGPSTYSGAMALGDVPPVLLSECWNDYHAMAAKAKYDAEWEKKSPW